MADAAASVVATLTARHWSIAVAESLTGGLLTAELVRIPGASLVLRGGIVAYDTSIKHSVLGEEGNLIESLGIKYFGPVDGYDIREMEKIRIEDPEGYRRATRAA